MEILKAINRELKPTLYLLENMAMNDQFVALSPEKQDNRFQMIGETHLMMRKIRIIEKAVESMRKACLSEINGTYYEDCVKPYEDDESEYDSEINNVYTNILMYWDFYPNPHIGDDIADMVDRYSEVSNALTSGLMSHFPGIKPYAQNADGELEETTLTDVQISSSLKAGALLSGINVFNSRMQEIKEIAEQKGNLGTILELLKD